MRARVELHPELKKWVDVRVPRYPSKRSLLVPALLQSQKYHGYVSPEVELGLANLLEMPPQEVHSVASFYSMLHPRPVGRHLIQVCHNVCCYLRGVEEVVARLEDALGIRVGETTEDGRFTLITVECLAACGKAPVMMIDERLVEEVTPDEAERALHEFE